MPEGLMHLFSARPWRDVVVDVFDVIVVAYVIYRALLLLRGTRAMQMGTGLGFLLLLYVASKYLGLLTMQSIMSTLLASLILVVVVVFQNDIRRGLMRMGAQAFFAGQTRQQESRVIDEVVAAVTDLARHRMGALICFEQDANLDEFVVGQGTIVDGAVQRELLVSLFVPESVNKLHDGAVIIRNFRVYKAGVFFPMPDLRQLDKALGSRHRAALGITEETDAVVVVVSEERGTIAFCFNGNIVTGLDGASLRQALQGLFGQARKGKAGAKDRASRAPTGTGSVRLARTSLPPASGRGEEAARGARERDADDEERRAEERRSDVPPPEERASIAAPRPVPMPPAKPIAPPTADGGGKVEDD